MPGVGYHEHFSRQGYKGWWYLFPGLEWVTPAGSVWKAAADPLSCTTVLDKQSTVVDQVRSVTTNEVEIVGRGVNNVETFLRDGSGITG